MQTAYVLEEEHHSWSVCRTYPVRITSKNYYSCSKHFISQV